MSEKTEEVRPGVPQGSDLDATPPWGMPFGEVNTPSLTEDDTTPDPGQATAVLSAVTTRCTTRTSLARCSTRSTRGNPNNDVVPSHTVLVPLSAESEFRELQTPEGQ